MHAQKPHPCPVEKIYLHSFRTKFYTLGLPYYKDLKRSRYIGNIITRWQRVISWIFSPIICGMISSFLYRQFRALVLPKENAVERIQIMLPFMFGIITFINLFISLNYGLKFLDIAIIPVWGMIILSLGVGVIIGLGVQYILLLHQKNSFTIFQTGSTSNELELENMAGGRVVTRSIRPISIVDLPGERSASLPECFEYDENLPVERSASLPECFEYDENYERSAYLPERFEYEENDERSAFLPELFEYEENDERSAFLPELFEYEENDERSAFLPELFEYEENMPCERSASLPERFEYHENMPCERSASLPERFEYHENMAGERSASLPERFEYDENWPEECGSLKAVESENLPVESGLLPSSESEKNPIVEETESEVEDNYAEILPIVPPIPPRIRRSDQDNLTPPPVPPRIKALQLP